MDRLKGKVCIVTGAAKGMGASHATAMVAEGAQLVLSDLDPDGQQLATCLGSAATFVRHDVASADSWQSLVEEAERRFGPIHVLVNNAGVAGGASIEDISLEEYRRLIEINQIGPFLGIKAVLPSMKRAGSGSIINISSIGGMAGSPNAVGYCDAKFALRGMSKVAAIELGKFGIRVNTVHPGAIKTPMTEGHPHYHLYEEMARLTPLGRMAVPDEISKMVVFLASDEASFSTGAEFIADGGALAG